MIEVRVDIARLLKSEHNILHSIEMIRSLKAAGVPVIGNIAMLGVSHGKLIQFKETGLDDEWVVQWFADDEITLSIHPKARGKTEAKGSGSYFTWFSVGAPARPVEDEEL